MNKYHSSYKQQKQKKVNDLCAKMRDGKERKRLASLGAPKEERAKNIHAMTISATDHRTGQTVDFELYETDNIRSYWVREKDKGWWVETAGLDRISKVLSKRFPRVGRFDG